MKTLIPLEEGADLAYPSDGGVDRIPGTGTEREVLVEQEPGGTSFSPICSLSFVKTTASATSNQIFLRGGRAGDRSVLQSNDKLYSGMIASFRPSDTEMARSSRGMQFRSN